MNAILFILTSGLAFFIGLALLAGAAALPMRGAGKRIARCRSLGAAIGVVAVCFSATPLAYVYYAALLGCCIFWGVCLRKEDPSVQRRGMAMSRALLCLCCALGAAMEAPHHFRPGMPPGKFPRLVVIGDSVSAGLGDDITWPEILVRERGVEVLDLSRAGATAASALARAGQVPAEPSLVLLEIGGNDLLAPTPPGKFAERLENLLSAVSGRGHCVVMMELPLPPFFNPHGMAQRRIAKAHGAILLPKRLFARILFSPRLTADGLHLSEEGAAAFADMIWEALGPSLSVRP